jgi:hypothetical protein
VCPTIPTLVRDQLDVEGDALYSKNCCAVAHFLRRAVVDLLRDQHLVIRAAKMYRYELNLYCIVSEFQIVVCSAVSCSGGFRGAIAPLLQGDFVLSVAVIRFTAWMKQRMIS